MRKKPLYEARKGEIWLIDEGLYMCTSEWFTTFKSLERYKYLRRSLFLRILEWLRIIKPKYYHLQPDEQTTHGIWIGDSKERI